MSTPVRLAYYMYKHDLFGKGNSVTILKVLVKYLELEKPFFPNNIVKNRDIDESLVLFKSMVNEKSYINSSHKLSRVLTVLKEDFLERGRNDK